MNSILGFARRLATPRQWALYALAYAACGFMNNQIGIWLELAEFRYPWQVLTVYVLYLVPASLMVRRRPVAEQYAWGMVVLGFLELGGYALETSIAHPDNLFDRVFGVRNFSLAMTLMFAALLPAGNLLLGIIERSLFGASTGPEAESNGTASPTEPPRP